jgi:hypothetical protein
VPFFCVNFGRISVKISHFWEKLNFKSGCADIGINLTEKKSFFSSLDKNFNGTARIRHQCRKAAVLSYHRFLINSGVEKMNNI